MSDFFDDEYDDEPTTAQPQNTGPKALRDYAEQQKQRADQLEERLVKIEADNRRAQLASALKGTGVNPDELGEELNKLDPEKAADQVAAWRRAFGLDTQGTPAGISAEDAAAVAAVTGEPVGTTPTTSNLGVDDIKSIDNEAAFAKAMGWR